MKTLEIINEIKNGKPFSYPATLSTKRIYTITINEKGTFILSANNLKSKEPLNENQAINIITNVLNP